MNQIFDFLKKYLGSRKLQKQFRKIIELLVGFLSIFTFGIFIYQLGYLPNTYAENYIPFFFNCALILLGIGILVRLLIAQQSRRNLKFYFDLGTGILFVIGAMINWEAFGNLSDEALIISKKYFLINILVILIFIQVLGNLSLQVNKLRLAPSLIFILSFLILILIGAALLSLPKATTHPITFIDAVFTSTSAVCVTGLIVLDTSKDFTEFGQIIIMTLFQIGGLGMMTFTTFFGFFFKGSLSVQNSLFLKDYITETNIGEISSTLIKIIVFTILVEFFAAVLIFTLSDPGLFRSFGDRAFFSAFHAISAFCNAGFSTLSAGLYEPGFRLMYSMHLVVAFTIILGGIGFPVFINYYSYLSRITKGAVRQVLFKEKYRHISQVANINTRLVMYTTGALLFIGFVTYLYFEQNNSLEGLSPYGKIVTAFFGSVTPRTAGFNTIDMSTLSVPMILIYLILMWIGASPGSTGGGLKTSTFALAILNTWSIAKGRNRVEVFMREISSETLRKAFAIIFLSFFVIGTGVFFVMIFNPELAILDVAFEVFSAFSTVGLSLGITAQLAAMSKVTIIIIMFLGRVGTLTILVAITRKITEQHYKYPEGNVYIT